jgi:hypothetical protein
LCLPSGWEEDDGLGIRLRDEFGGEKGGKSGELVLAGDQREVCVTDSCVAMSVSETVEMYS